MRYHLLLVVGLLFSGGANAGILGYDNYWDCIIEEMPGVQNDVAARAVLRKCNNEAPNRTVERKRFTFLGMNAEKCLLKNAKDVRSNLGAAQIRWACRSLYE